MSDRKRASDRLTLHHYINVRNLSSGLIVGEVVNLTPEGLMIVSDEAFARNTIYPVQFILPQPIGRLSHIELGIECLWCRQADTSDRFWSGYQIIDASTEAQQAICELLRQEFELAGTLAAG